MAPPTLLELAQQGDPQAIAALLNRQLQPQGITAKVAVREGCLHVLLESAQQPPDRQACVDFVRTELTSLEPESIDRAKVYGRKTGEKEPAWSQEFGLEFGAFSMLILSQAQEKSSPPPPETSETLPLPQNQPDVKQPRSVQIAAGAIAAVLLVAALVFAAQKLTISAVESPNAGKGAPAAPAVPNR
ncbi:MAG: hypothetical protein KME26_07735 [Oscillatoria princeps RMCB-10]|jgi:hypothetical protein|nr:hypothetical protein [Oscillatoria princeps RMCB-10]